MTQHKATITRLDIAGFKSFSDEVHLDIQPGLTGIVGPNGCGKSNIVEALRWTMGESSARALRGGESDDLIFSGTSARPSRNLAKVTLLLKDSQNLAPKPFDNFEELNISRQVERGRGSTYRINGQVTRAKDVQTIFADLSSGARSSSIISQNRVSQLISAKPEERRSLLEEAAGITGLYARRHDAELKLRQSETNLQRAEDRRQQLSEHIKTLEKQAHKSRDYRLLSEKIRDTERYLIATQYARNEKSIQQHQQAFSNAQDMLKKAEQHLEKLQKILSHSNDKASNHKRIVDSLRPTIENLRVEIKVSQNNLEHSQKEQKNINDRLYQINYDLKRQKDTRNQILKRQENIAQEIKSLQDKKDFFPEKILQHQQELKDIQKKITQQQHIIHDTTDNYHKKSLERESFNGRLQERQHQYKEGQISLRKLNEDDIFLEKKFSEQPSLEQAHDQYVKTREKIQISHENMQEISTAYQEKLVKLELSTHSLKEAEKKAIYLEKCLQEISTHLNALNKRYQDQIDIKHKNYNYLLSDEERNIIKNDIVLKKEKLRSTQDKEKELLIKKENAEQVWLTERAQQEENQQKRSNLEKEIKDTLKTLEKQKEYINNAQKSLKYAQEQCIDKNNIQQYYQDLNRLEKELKEYSIIRLSTQKDFDLTTKERDKKHHNMMKEEAKLSQLKGEYEGIRQSLGSDETQSIDPLIDHISIPDTLTRAFTSALTEGLEASLSLDSAPRYWRHLSAFPQQDLSTTQLHSLAHYIKDTPAPLLRALSAVFLVENVEQGNKIQSKLAPGQSLVNYDGYFWRWDGFVRSNKAPSAEIIRLEQKQRLKQCEYDIEEKTRILQNTYSILENYKESLISHRNALAVADKNYQKIREQYHQKQHYINGIEQQIHFQNERLNLANEHLNERNQQKIAIEKHLKNLQKTLESLPIYQSENLEKLYEISQNLKKRSLEAHELYQHVLNEFHISKRRYENAILHHETAQERLQECEKTSLQLTQEIASNRNDYDQFKNELEKLDLRSLHLNLQKVSDDLQKEVSQRKIYQAEHEKNEKNTHECLQKYSQLERTITTLKAQRDSLKQRYNQQIESHSILEKDISTLKKTLKNLPDLAPIQEKLDKSHRLAKEYQEKENAINNQIINLKQEKNMCHTRIEAQQQQYNELNATIIHSNEEEKRLRDQHEKLSLSLQKNEASCRTLKKDMNQNLENLTDLETKVNIATTNLNNIEKEKNNFSSEKNNQHAIISRYREEIIRSKERLEHALHSKETLQKNTPLPNNLPSLKEITVQAEQNLRRSLKQYTQERDALGAVNLCAEDEHKTACEEVEHLLKEYSDLTAAIDRLRGGINTINRHGRKKLTQIFVDINQHFQKLFERMFSGGKAHLAMIGNSDPLEAGLEIFAQPPGKKLSALSLLSGGEQALTALSLIFAAFYCTPAPICVLDEVDAPLDDANIERFCSLLTDMAEQTKTRFLVVTHHQLTMAHMDRLYGITMQERGVSRLLSVNLDESIRMTNG